MKHKLILEIKKLATEIENSSSFNTKFYKDSLKELQEKFVVLEYLENNINELVEEVVTEEEISVEEQVIVEDLAEEKEETNEVLEFESSKDAFISEEIVVEEVEIKEESLVEEVKHELESLQELEKKIDSAGNREVKKSLNDELKKSTINIGLNDRIAFVKKLFDGNQQDFNRVLSQVNSFNSKEELINFIDNYVKPDYKWEENQEYAERFMELIASKFE